MSDVYFSIPVTNYKQINDHYCGPAVALQSLSFHKRELGISASLPSQSTLASRAGTTRDGSTSTGLRDALKGDG